MARDRRLDQIIRAAAYEEENYAARRGNALLLQALREAWSFLSDGQRSIVHHAVFTNDDFRTTFASISYHEDR